MPRDHYSSGFVQVVTLSCTWCFFVDLLSWVKWHSIKRTVSHVGAA